MADESPREDEVITSFVSKLWELVEYPEWSDYICWSKNGKSFIIKDQQGFCTKVLPKVYRHNNLSSFIRQLNMYGFHKKIDSSKSASENASQLEFYHRDFVRGRRDLLKLVKRKSSDEKRLKLDLGGFYSEVEDIRNRNDCITSQLEALKSQNTNLWQEIFTLRAKHERQNQVIHKLVNFFFTFLHNNGSESLPDDKKLMLLDRPGWSQELSLVEPNSSTKAIVPTTQPIAYLPSSLVPALRPQTNPVTLTLQNYNRNFINTNPLLVPQDYSFAYPATQNTTIHPVQFGAGHTNPTHSSTSTLKTDFDISEFLDLKESTSSNKRAVQTPQPSAISLDKCISDLELDLNLFQDRLPKNDLLDFYLDDISKYIDFGSQSQLDSALPHKDLYPDIFNPSKNP